MKRQSKRGGGTAAAATATVLGPSQQQLYEEAIRAFHLREFARAQPLFESAANGANREMAHSARLHARMCEHRIANAPPAPETAEEHYNLAIALINRGEFAAAGRHLERALESAPDADYVHYAMALSRGRQGDIEGAHRHLKRAIELQPGNRMQARADADFSEFIRCPEIQALVFSRER